jgi:putative membrane protein (TIGR04086 family)
VSRLDTSAILVGAGSALAVIVPVVVIARLVVVDDDVGATGQYLFAALILTCTLAGSIVAGRREPSAPFLHGALAGLLVFVVAQVVSSIVAGEFPNPVAFVFFALVFMCLGAIGGFVAHALRSRRSHSAQERSS